MYEFVWLKLAACRAKIQRLKEEQEKAEMERVEEQEKAEMKRRQEAEMKRRKEQQERRQDQVRIEANTSIACRELAKEYDIPAWDYS